MAFISSDFTHAYMSLRRSKPTSHQESWKDATQELHFSTFLMEIHIKRINHIVHTKTKAVQLKTANLEVIIQSTGYTKQRNKLRLYIQTFFFVLEPGYWLTFNKL